MGNNQFQIEKWGAGIISSPDELIHTFETLNLIERNIRNIRNTGAILVGSDVEGERFVLTTDPIVLVFGDFQLELLFVDGGVRISHNTIELKETSFVEESPDKEAEKQLSDVLGRTLSEIIPKIFSTIELLKSSVLLLKMRINVIALRNRCYVL